MRLNAREVSVAIDEAISSRLRADPPELHEEEAVRFNLFGRAEREGFDEVWDALIDEHGPDAVLAALAPYKDDPLIAAVLTHTCEIYRVRLRDYFTAAEIVAASETSLLAPVWWKSGILDGGSLWSAVYGHDYGHIDHFEDEEHFQLLVALLDRIPVDDDYALFLIGDGPLSHAAEVFHDRIRELSKKHPPLARAWFLNLTDGVREFDAVTDTVLSGRSGDPVAVAVEISPDVTYGVVLTHLSSHDDYLLDDLLRHTGWCAWESVTTGSGGGIQWSPVEEGRGILRYSGVAPAGSRTAIVDHRGGHHPVPVKDGYFLYVDWNSDTPSEPRVERFE